MNSSQRRRSELNELTHQAVPDGRVRIVDVVEDVFACVQSRGICSLASVVNWNLRRSLLRSGPYSSVVEHSLRKRKVGGSIPPGGFTYA